MKRLSLLPRAAAALALFLSYSLFPALSQDTPSAANRLVAFVAAVSDYPGNSAMYESLANAQRITESISALDFKVTSLFNFTKSEFEESFQAWCKEAANAEVAFVYLCGHGGNQDGENYLFPIGTEASALSQLPEQCIGLRAMLETLIQGQEKGKRLNLVAIDGSRENPFLSRAFGFEDGNANASAFYSLPYLPLDTIVISPTGPGELIDRQDTTLLAEALSAHLFVDNTDLRRGLESVRNLIREKTGGYLYPTLAIEFDGNLTFKRRLDGTQTLITFPVQKPEGDRFFEELDAQAKKSFKNGKLISAIKTLLKICNEIPGKRDIAISDLKAILTSSSLEDPYVGIALIESSEFDFATLASETVDSKGGGGLNLKEARKVFWNSGRWFPKHWDTALQWAEYDAKQGDSEAMRICGDLYLKKGNEEQKKANKEKKEEYDKKAVEWYKMGAEQSSRASGTEPKVWSMVALGQLYLMGRGVAEDFSQAEKYFSEARKVGDPRGAAGLGAIELNKLLKANNNDFTNADSKNYNESINYFREAHDRKFFKNSYRLGTLLWIKSQDAETKAVAAKFRKEAIDILLAGADEGIDSSCMWQILKLVSHFETTISNQRDQVKNGDETALPLLDEAIEIEKELLVLVPKDKRTELLKQAADLGFPEAMEEAKRSDIDYFEAAKPLCEKWNQNYRLRKADMEMANTIMLKKN